MIEDVVKASNLTIRIPPEVLEPIKALAAAETRSVNGEIVQLLKEALAARGNN
jgi:hypothetical protein